MIPWWPLTISLYTSFNMHTVTSHHHKWSESQLLSDSLRPQGLYYPWNSQARILSGSLSLLHKDSMNRQKKYFLHLMDADILVAGSQVTVVLRSHLRFGGRIKIPTQLFCWSCPSTALLWHCLSFAWAQDHLFAATMDPPLFVFQDCQLVVTVGRDR